MNNNNNNKLTHKFNIIDVLIIAGIIAAAVFGVYMLSGDIFENRIQTVEYCIMLDGVSDITAVSELESGNRLFSTNMNIPAGIIKKVKTENMAYVIYDRNAGRYITKQHDALYNVYIYVDAGCVFENGAYRTENIRISENTAIDVNVPFLYDGARIINVKPLVSTEVN